jgi:hypothetical protein
MQGSNSTAPPLSDLIPVTVPIAVLATCLFIAIGLLLGSLISLRAQRLRSASVAAEPVEPV